MFKAPNTNEKKITKLCFIDSYKFLISSLDKLALYLSKDKLRIMQCEFCNLSAKNFDLLTRKSILPYEYTDCVEKLEETELPPPKSFYSSLTGDTVSEDNYTHAVNMWQRFSIRTLEYSEYSDLYIKQMSWLTFLKTFATIVSRITRSYVLLYITRFYVGRDVKTSAYKF